MVKRYLSTKFGINLLDGEYETTGFMNVGRTTDARMMAVAVLCTSTKQS